MASYSAIITSGEVFIAEGLHSGADFSKWPLRALPRFVDVSIGLHETKRYSEKYQTPHKVRNDTLQR